MKPRNKYAFGPDGSKIVVQPEAEPTDPRALFFLPKWDEDFVMDPVASRTIALGEKLDRPILLVGPTGCGKTTLVRNMANLLSRPCRRINLYGDVRSGELLGEKTVEIDPTTGQSVVVWRDGVVTDCKRNGWWLILDEIDACPPQIAFVLQSLLEPGHPLVLAGNGGEIVEQEIEGPGMRIFATANTLGRGDSSGVYAGTNTLNEAFLDRFLVSQVGYLDKNAEAELLKPVLGPLAEKVVEFATMAREGFAKGETTATVSTRRLVAWAEVAKELRPPGKGLTATTQEILAALKAAYPLVIGDKLSKEDGVYFRGIVERHLPFATSALNPRFDNTGRPRP